MRVVGVERHLLILGLRVLFVGSFARQLARPRQDVLLLRFSNFDQKANIERSLLISTTCLSPTGKPQRCTLFTDGLRHRHLNAGLLVIFFLPLRF